MFAHLKNWRRIATQYDWCPILLLSACASPQSSFIGCEAEPWAGPDMKEPLDGFNRRSFRSILSETRFLDRHREAPIGQTIERLVEERVVRRDLWVALLKLCHQGDYTFLIETDDGRLRFSKKNGPVFTNPYLGPAVTFIATATSSPVVGHTNRGRLLNNSLGSSDVFIVRGLRNRIIDLDSLALSVDENDGGARRKPSIA